jgi:cyclopropane fatty-acyl-phospholipid synthase-like methyltransferase
MPRTKHASGDKRRTIGDQMPRSSKYDRRWVLSNSLGENVLYNAESLCKALGLRRGMRVLDLGCGRAISSIFIAREFKCYVWAVDRNISAHENLERIRAHKVEKRVVPVQCDARDLPFPKSFFDVIIAVDSYMYYGEEPDFLPYVIQFLKPGGRIGVLDACFSREVTSQSKPPGFLRRVVRSLWRRMHSVRWWRRLWENTGLVQIVSAEMLPNSDELLSEYVRDRKDEPSEQPAVDLVRQDKRHFIKLFRMIAQKKSANSKPR